MHDSNSASPGPRPKVPPTEDSVTTYHTSLDAKRSSTGEHLVTQTRGRTKHSDYTEAPPSISEAAPRASSGGGQSSIWAWLTALAAAIGAIYAALATHSFVMRLDGDTHAVACGIFNNAESGGGCVTALLSPYSSMFRDQIWGGIPISLPAFGVFTYLVGLALYVALKRNRTRADAGFLLLATVVPVAASAVFGYIALVKLGELCSTCLGIYVSSGFALFFALIGYLRTQAREPAPWPRWLIFFAQGVFVVGALLWLYVSGVPADRPGVEKGCGELVKRSDDAKILMREPAPALASGQTRTPALIVVDPLCPSCKGLHQRLQASELSQRLDVELLSFPLDAKCNWMVKSSPHPGACLVSEAMLCAPESSSHILEYAYAEQDRLLELGRTNEAALKADLEQRFPAVKGCVGSAAAKALLNRSLRFAVANAMPVMTPQLFIDGTRVCDEDTDLGLEYTLTRMLSRAKAQ